MSSGGSTLTADRAFDPREKRDIPNWTTNYLHVEGTPEAITKIKSAYKEADPEASYVTDTFDFETFLWGTKWNSNGAEILHSDETRLVVRFDSAWSEPSGIFSHLRSLEGVSEVEHVSLHEGGGDPTMSEGWERYFEMDVETYRDEAPDGEVITYTNTSVSYSPDAEVTTGAGPTV